MTLCTNLGLYSIMSKTSVKLNFWQKKFPDTQFFTGFANGTSHWNWLYTVQHVSVGQLILVARDTLSTTAMLTGCLTCYTKNWHEQRHIK